MNINNYKNKGKLNMKKIIDTYSNYIYTIVHNMAKNNLTEEDVEEIVADTFFILWKNADKMEDERKMSSYIAGIVRNLVYEKSRQVKFHYDIYDYQNILQDRISIDTLAEERSQIDIIEKSLEKLSQEDIKIFNMYYYSSMKIREIADFMECSELKVKSKLYRIRKKLRKNLEGGKLDA